MNVKRILSVIALASLIFFVIGEWMGTPKISPRPPASHEDLLHAAKSMRQQSISTLNMSPRDRAMIALGKKFFFDPRFSKNQAISCSSCHDPQKSFTDGQRVATGIGSSSMNVPTLINVKNGRWFFHNGRADSLEMQALGPVENPVEQGFTRVEVATVIKQYYQAEYEKIFGPIPPIALSQPTLPSRKPIYVSDAVAAYVLGTLGSKDFQKVILGRAHDRSVQPIKILQEDSAGGVEQPTAFDQSSPEEQNSINQLFANFAQTIAAFERTIRTEDSPFDRFADQFVATTKVEQSFVDGFGESEFNGFKTFVGEGQCTLCHQGPDFTDHQFHNIGLPALDAKSIDLGRAQGLLLAKENIFNCTGSYFKHLSSESEACAELQFAETENSELIGAFKTPTLRNLRDTAPYGHDGRFPKLRDVLLHYNLLPGVPALGHREESLQPLKLSDQQLSDLEAFLNALYGKTVAE